MKDTFSNRFSELAEQIEPDDRFVDEVMHRVSHVGMHRQRPAARVAGVALTGIGLVLLGVVLGRITVTGSRQAPIPLQAVTHAHSTGRPAADTNRLLSLEYAPATDQLTGVILATSDPWPDDADVVLILSPAAPDHSMLASFGMPLRATSITRGELLEALDRHRSSGPWEQSTVSIALTTESAEPLRALIRRLTARAVAMDTSPHQLSLREPRYD